MRGLHLLAGGRELLLGVAEPLLEHAGLLAPARAPGLRRRLGRGRDLGDDDHDEPGQAGGLHEPPHREVHADGPAVHPDLQPAEHDRPVLAERVPERAGQLRAEPVTGHGEDVPVGPAGGRLEEPARPAVGVEDIPGPRGQHYRRPVLPQDQPVGQLLQVGGRHRPGSRGRVAGLRQGDRGREGRRRRRGLPGPAEEPELRVDRGEEVREGPDRLGRAEDEHAPRVERVVEEGDQALLDRRLQVDQQVPAGEDVDPGERRVREQVLRGEDHHPPDLLSDPVPGVVPDEEPGEALLADVGRDGLGVPADPGPVDGVDIEVGGVDLERAPLLRREDRERLAEDDGQRVGLLAGRAAGDPGAERGAVRGGPYELREHPVPERVPDGGVAEEAGHADQELPEEQVTLGRVLLQKPDIVHDPVELVDGHAPVDPPVDHGLLVQGEVVVRAVPQQDDDPFVVAGLRRRRLDGRWRHAPDDAENPVGQLVGRADDLGEARGERALRHALELGRGRVLDDDEPALLLDRAEAQGAVRAHAREDDADGQLLQVRGKRAEEVVDGQAQAPRRVRLQEVEGPVEEGEVVIRRDHVDRVRPDGQAVRDLDHRHRGGALEELGEHPPVRRVQVLDDHEGHAALGRDAGEELLEGLEPAGRRADPDDGDCIVGHRAWGRGVLRAVGTVRFGTGRLRIAIMGGRRVGHGGSHRVLVRRLPCQLSI